MPGVKTAISIEENLFHKVNKMAQELAVSRSQVITLALQNFIEQQRNRALLAQLDSVYGEQPTDEEVAVSKAMQQKHASTIATDP